MAEPVRNPVFVVSNHGKASHGPGFRGFKPRQVERGILMYLGRHLVPVLSTWFRIRWSYAHRVRDVAAWVSGIAKASPLMAHQANKYFNDIRSADVAYIKVRNVRAHSWARHRGREPCRAHRGLEQRPAQFRVPHTTCRNQNYKICPKGSRRNSQDR
jgi:hypothetical protein